MMLHANPVMLTVMLLLQGKYDDLPEMAFYMVGDITEVQQKADQMAKDIAARKVRTCSQPRVAKRTAGLLP
jgi:hypothetical protein